LATVKNGRCTITASSGWVKANIEACSAGTVEAAVHGEPAAVDAIVRWARRGPQHAQVERVDIEPDDGSYTSFEVIG
jgi:acylphosphatase